MRPIRRHHSLRVIALTSKAPRNTRRNVLLLARPGGRVMGSYDQMTLLHAYGRPDTPACQQARNGVDVLVDPFIGIVFTPGSSGLR